ncbi:phenylalanine--tRNA ligase subunit beta [Gilvimarinus sp. F26214L]|uniref:phenylalanine--tRNA ligase subunit beta n=1 Tax=Gilvimarinus sp. DZF01 TaxID=3461371 RepID=UPI00404650C0
MKISESWLREWVSPDIDTAALAEQLTMAGLEVDAIEPVAGEFTGVVVGEIVAAEQHPDADKLQVCQVNAGGDGNLQVVCGAPNARPGIRVPFATIGAVLPGNFKIKKAKLRGVESQGMLCAQTELQAGDDDSGLWELPGDAPVGTALEEYLKLSDSVIEVDLTPNRGDCLSMRGIAREIGVLNRLPVTEPAFAAVAATSRSTLALTIEAKEQCPRYVGRVIEGLDPSRPSPLWLQERLRRAGIRPHDCVVDVTNYVLLEQGQPMHAFDRSKLVGGINVRLAKAGETIELLDGQQVDLREGTLLITDEQGPVALAGIMGGARSAVSDSTRDIFLESAFFSQLAMAGTARSYGLHTDASHRYERGVDYELPLRAMERATQLLTEIAGGSPGPVVVEESPEHLPADRQVALRRERIAKGLGFSLADEEVVDILTRLGLELLETRPEGWSFQVPSYRFDIAIEEDLLEELARIYGYNRLPTVGQPMRLTMGEQPEAQICLPALKEVLVARGFHEAITYSFIGEDLARLFDPQGQPVRLQNPLSADLAVMRSSLLPSLVQTLTHNLNRQQSRVRLFEAGMRFRLEEGLQQEPMLAGLISGSRRSESWSEKEEPVDFYDLKGDVEALLARTGCADEFAFEAGKQAALHPGRSAAILRNGETVGCLGALHPRIQQELDIAQPVYLFEIRQSALLNGAIPSFREISKFPEVRRDLAVLVSRDVQAEALLASARKAAGSYLRDLKVFDVYAGKGIDPQRKSVALGLTFQHPSRTLKDSEINASIDAVVTGLREVFDATLR